MVSTTIAMFALAVVIGVSFTVFGLLFAFDLFHTEVIARRTIPCEDLPAFFFLKLHGKDAFVAGRRINIQVQTGAIDLSVKTLNIGFEGAEQYYPGEYNLSDPSFFDKQFGEMRDALTANIITLTRNTLTTFAGNGTITYGSGGDWDIRISGSRQNGEVFEHVIKNAIRISPPEVLYQIRASNQRIGLALIAIGCTIIFGVASVFSKGLP